MAGCLLDEQLKEMVENSHVLVVGAGGIGCELIKNLVLTGFNNLSIVDLDTIDVSNLNRQFLFQKKHVGRSKVEVAKESALLFNPCASITAIHDSILSPDYNMTFFKQFSLVLNALDNKKARNHVNRLCLAAGVTLVESGSAGYLGQVTVIRKGESECYECQPAPAQKTYPSCTIRNNPSEPIHCVVWAKHLYSQLFGEPDADNDVSPDELLLNENEREDMEVEEEVNHENERLSTRTWAESNDYDPEKIFHKLFHTDIQYLLTMDKLWQNRPPPTPLTLTHLPEEDDRLSNGALPDQRVWSVRECSEALFKCIPALRDRQCSQGELVWDKDTSDDLDFVVATANLRASVFNIPLRSKFDVKSMAGNIIPAIATTNAVIAGLIVMEALKILSGRFDKCRTIYLPKQPNPRKHLLASCHLVKPNPKCYVCSPRPEVTLKLNTNSVTMATLQDKILIGHYGMVAPDVELEDNKGTILISSEEGETEENLPRRMVEFGVVDGARLRVDDFLQNYQLILNIIHSDEPLENDKEFIEVKQEETATEDVPSRKRAASSPPPSAQKRQKIDTPLES